jgi:hypothetical protein
VAHTTNAPQPSSPSFLGTPNQVSAHGMPIVQPDLNGEIATTIHIAHISYR